MKDMKDKIYYGLTILVFAVLLIAIFAGKYTNKEQGEKQVAERDGDRTELIRNESSPSPSDSDKENNVDSEDSIDSESNKQTTENSSSPSNAEKKRQQDLEKLQEMSEKIKKVNENLDREKIFSKSELKHSGKITADFFGKLLSYDKNNPDGKIREIMPYGDESVKLTLAKFLSKEGLQEPEHEENMFPLEIYKNDLMNVNKRTITDFKLQVPSTEQTPDFLDWEAVIDMELEMVDGTKKEITETYLISFQYFGKEMKVVYFAKGKNK